MFVAIEHRIHDASKFQECAERVFPLPEGLLVHQFLPAADMSRAACLYETESMDRLREYLDGTLGDASTQTYFPVAAEHAIGLPQPRLGG